MRIRVNFLLMFYVATAVVLLAFSHLLNDAWERAEERHAVIEAHRVALEEALENEQ